MRTTPAVLLQPREVPLGGVRAMLVRRTLPHRRVRTVGPWCFLDHYGPQQVSASGQGGMLVPPHPHTGLQTVTWLLEGQVTHDDSLGSHQLIRPGELNLMTAGIGIAHSEVSAVGEAGWLHGVQLWVALPDTDRWVAPRFEHHADLPRIDVGGVETTVLIGTLDGVTSPATSYSAIVGAAMTLPASHPVTVPLEPTYEHAVLGLDTEVFVDGRPLARGALLGFAPGRERLVLASDTATRVLLLGGEPFGEDLVMWWNFVGRSHEEVAEARTDWENGHRFGEVAFDGDRLPAPPMPATRLLPRRSRGLELTP